MRDARAANNKLALVVGRAGWLCEGEMGCGRHFLNRAAFPHGKRAENKLKTAIVDGGKQSGKSFKTASISRFYPEQKKVVRRNPLRIHKLFVQNTMYRSQRYFTGNYPGHVPI